MSAKIKYERIFILHNAGFFSNCSVRLHHIVSYINNRKKIPLVVDTSASFKWYKTEKNSNEDITFHYFYHYNNINKNIQYSHTDYNWTKQFEPYKTLDFKNISPLIEKYFSPSDEIKEKILELQKKYEINYNNICVLFYRGNDKATETKISSLEEYEIEVEKILKKEPNIKFLIQSDETNFIEYFSKKYTNHVVFNDEIRHMKKTNSTVDLVIGNNYYFSKYFLTIIIMASRCKYIVCGSGNCEIWMTLYRGHSNNLHQYLNGVWYTD